MPTPDRQQRRRRHGKKPHRCLTLATRSNRRQPYILPIKTRRMTILLRANKPNEPVHQKVIPKRLQKRPVLDRSYSILQQRLRLRQRPSQRFWALLIYPWKATIPLHNLWQHWNLVHSISRCALTTPKLRDPHRKSCSTIWRNPQSSLTFGNWISVTFSGQCVVSGSYRDSIDLEVLAFSSLQRTIKTRKSKQSWITSWNGNG